MTTEHIKNRLILLVILVGITSCNRFTVQPYFSNYWPNNENSSENRVGFSNSKKSIILISDSTLNYSIILGGIGISTTIKYKKDLNEIVVDSVDIYNRKSFQSYSNEIFSRNFSYTKDSLIDNTNNEIYYTRNFAEKRIRNSKYIGLYIILNEKKKKVTALNRRRIMKKISSQKYELTEMSKDDAKNTYDIERNYITVKLTKK